MTYIDLRSDTVTRPSPGMREAMMNAEVGDDVFGEDPTVNRLQERMATLFGKERALFVPSGTMGNEICIKVLTEPGDEVIVEEDSHVFIYETAAPSILSAVQMKTLPGRNGMISFEDIERAIRPQAYYLPRTKLICLENTHGRSGGAILPLKQIEQISGYARSRNIRLHLDGARLWNASVATGISMRDYGRYFDTLSVCFSKGLGAPIGSMILGDERIVESARRYRKIFGGGMRQVGILAAAANYALEHNVDRLREDHDKAKMFGKMLSGIQTFSLVNSNVETNMVIINIQQTEKTQNEILNLLKINGILMTPEGHNSIRAVMHLDVSEAEVKEAADKIVKIFS
jgi:threonine aldolase